MKLLSKIIELGFFSAVNLLFASSAIFITRRCSLETSCPFMFCAVLFFVKIKFFELLYNRKFLRHIRAFFDKFLTDKKFFLLTIICTVAIDAICGLALPEKAQKGVSSFYDFYDFFIFAGECRAFIWYLASGITFTYLGFWIIKKPRKRKRKRLAGFDRVVSNITFSPLYLSFKYSLVLCIAHLITGTDFLIWMIPIYWLLATATCCIISVPTGIFSLFVGITAKNKKIMLRKAQFYRLISIIAIRAELVFFVLAEISFLYVIGLLFFGEPIE